MAYKEVHLDKNGVEAVLNAWNSGVKKSSKKSTPNSASKNKAGSGKKKK